MENVLTTLVEAPGRFQRYIDGCTCGRADKAAVTAIKMELEQKDIAIERLEEEIRRKDTEKDNLIHMQKDLQAQIEEIRRVLEVHASQAPAPPAGSEDDTQKAALMMQSRARGIHDRKQVQQIKEQKQAVMKVQAKARGNRTREKLDEKQRMAAMMQARARGKSTRKMMEQKRQDGTIVELPGGQRLAAEGKLPVGGAPAATGGAASDISDLDEGELSPRGSPGALDDESVDSDYDYSDSAFAELGLELLSGRLKLAKVYGQEEPPAAEDELEWETRYFVLFDTRKMCHFDDMQDGLPVGDRGLIDLDQIKSVEKVLGVPTFVMKSTNKVYLFKLDPHDEVMMRTWIGAISVELNQ